MMVIVKQWIVLGKFLISFVKICICIDIYMYVVVYNEPVTPSSSYVAAEGAGCEYYRYPSKL